MAKARRPPFAAAERFLGFPRGGPSPGAVAPAPAAFDDLRDLAEADVWYSAAAADPGSPCPAASRQVEAEGRSTGQRGAPRRGVHGGLSQAFGDGPGRQVAASAPVEVPAWPARFAVPDAEPALLFEMEMGDDDEEDGKRGAGGWVPPHVYLAQRQARASVVEGAGRTLKGRDMSRVRDAVWSRTGFDG
ncbi:protein S40-6-like [Miscanthus floridulus]|uniref:protein S40-6-like n=1 Tax=Miscanthus floridulus TaxID=154761 RepID=UPI003458C2BD